MPPDPLDATIRLAHAAATWVMVGVIWYVQLVHYPLMDRVRTEPEGAFGDFERAHQRGTAAIVAPAMLLELATAVWLALAAGGAVERGLAWSGLALAAVNWASTAGLQMPCHRRLESGFDADTHRRLVKSNRIRTAAWSLRGAIAAALLAV